MTRIVDGLIAEHLAERLPHPTDGRAVVIAATAEGQTLMRTAQRRRIDTLASALAALPLDQQLVLASAGPCSTKWPPPFAASQPDANAAFRPYATPGH